MKTKKVDDFLALVQKRPKTKFAVIGKGTTWTFYEGSDLAKATADPDESLLRATLQKSSGALKVLVAGGAPEVKLMKDRVFAAPLKAKPTLMSFKTVKAEDGAALDQLQDELDGPIATLVERLPEGARAGIAALLEQAENLVGDGDLEAAKAAVAALKQQLAGSASAKPEQPAARPGGPGGAKPSPSGEKAEPSNAGDAIKQRIATIAPRYQTVLKVATANKARLELLMKAATEAAKTSNFKTADEALDKIDEQMKFALEFVQFKAEKDITRRKDLGQAFLDKYGAAFPKEYAEAEDLQAMAMKEWGVTEAKKAYEAQVKGDATSPHNAGNQFGTTLTGADEKKKILNEPKVKEFAAKYKLDESEVIAIRTYTAADYKYINPAVANQKDHPERQKPGGDGKPIDWMTSQNRPDPSKAQNDFQRKKLEEDLAKWDETKKRMEEEGALHAGMIMEAFKKLPKKAGKLYRGARMNMDRFNGEYSKGKETPIEAFMSQSTSEKVARGFADGTSGNIKLADDATVSVFVEAEIVDARDVSGMSIYPGEGEWLLPPGGKLVVASIEDDSVKNPGKPKATAWKRVKMRQVVS